MSEKLDGGMSAGWRVMDRLADRVKRQMAIQRKAETAGEPGMFPAMREQGLRSRQVFALLVATGIELALLSARLDALEDAGLAPREADALEAEGEGDG